MKTITKMTVVAVALTAFVAAAQYVVPGWRCTDGYTWVSMAFAQPVGTDCHVAMPNGLVFHGWTVR